MSSTPEDNILRLLNEALQLPAEKRGDYLRRHCPDDEGLVEHLIRCLEHDTDTLPPPGPPTEIPARIGPYRILEMIGKGGMGVVYSAEQSEPIQQKVAIKVIKVGLDTEEVLGRFEAEHRALGLMSHPNIARVLDAWVPGRVIPWAEAPATQKPWPRSPAPHGSSSSPSPR